MTTSRSREEGAHTSGFSLDDSPSGNFSSLTPKDIEAWIQAGNTEHFSIPGPDCPEMTGKFQEIGFAKDDNVSISSSMGDSGYMSQQASVRRGPPSAGSQRQDITSGPSLDSYLVPDYCSPTLSTGSQTFLPSSQSDMSHMFLPPPAGDQSFDDIAFGISEFANCSTGQMQGRSPSFDFNDQYMPRPFHTQSEFTINQDDWSANDVQTFSRPFAVSSIEATALPYAHTHFTQPYTLNTDLPVSRPSSQSGQIQRHPSTATSTPIQAANPDQFRIDQAGLTTRSSSSRRTSGMSQESNMPEANQLVSPVSVINTPRPMKAEQNFEEDTYAAVSSTIMQRSPTETRINEQSRSVPRSSSSEEAEMKVARAHPLYHATPRADDLYHCPYEGQPGCQHKPTKLKCNYDKYVDSHLKPFRCKVPSCATVEFSSTACLLRHEREAHGMHGHGSKPHLCIYADCERAIPGNGFPRRYNLLDHMKRVHDHTGPSPSSPNTSPTAVPDQQTIKRQNSKKRKSPSGDQQPSERRQKSNTAKTQAPAVDVSFEALQEQKRKGLQAEWSKRRVLLLHRVQSLRDPQDIDGHLQVSEDVTVLRRIAQQITDLG